MPCPLLLDQSKYKPDLEDLVADEKAREYWLNCFESGLSLVRFCNVSHINRVECNFELHSI